MFLSNEGSREHRGYCSKKVTSKNALCGTAFICDSVK